MITVFNIVEVASSLGGAARYGRPFSNIRIYAMRRLRQAASGLDGLFRQALYRRKSAKNQFFRNFLRLF